MLLTIYSFVFSVVLPGLHSKETEPYALFMFCGILPWTWFSSSLTEAAGSHFGRQPDQESAVSGRSAADCQCPGEHGAFRPRPANPGRISHLLSAPARRRGPPVVSRRDARPVDPELRPRADRLGPRGALSRHPRHPVERADPLVLFDADHLLDQGSPGPR